MFNDAQAMGHYSHYSDTAMEVLLQRIKPLMAQETGQLNIFDGIRLDEVDVLRRAFRDYGYRVRKSNPAVSKRFTEFSTLLDDIMKMQLE